MRQPGVVVLRRLRPPAGGVAAAVLVIRKLTTSDAFDVARLDDLGVAQLEDVRARDGFFSSSVRTLALISGSPGYWPGGRLGGTAGSGPGPSLKCRRSWRFRRLRLCFLGRRRRRRRRPRCPVPDWCWARGGPDRPGSPSGVSRNQARSPLSSDWTSVTSISSFIFDESFTKANLAA
jgi:hypothetical protein